MADQRRAGTVYVKVNGEIQDAKGNFSYGFGTPKRDAMVGADRVHGYTEKPTVPFIEGALTDRSNLDVKAVFNGKDVTVTLELANGKTVVLSEGWFAGDPNVSTEEAEIPVRWESTIELEEV